MRILAALQRNHVCFANCKSSGSHKIVITKTSTGIQLRRTNNS